MSKKIAVCILTFIVATLMAFSLVACDKKVEKHNTVAEGAYPSALASNISGEELVIIGLGLQEGATPEQVREAVFVMYNVANRSRKTADLSLMIQHTVSGSGVSAMTFNGFEIKSGNAWYYQLPREAGMDFLCNAQVAYTHDSETFYYAKIDDSCQAKCSGIDVFPYAEFLLTEKPKAYDFDGFREHRFFLDDQLELCNMALTLDLVDETSEIDYDAENHVYTVRLVVDCDGASEEELKAWAAQAQAEANSEMVVERHYQYWNATIKIWDNGYVKSLDYEEYWTGKIAGTFDLDGPAESHFNFFYIEDEILAFLEQDPRYAKLSEEEREAILTPLDYIEFYSGAEIDAKPLKSWETALIVIGCVLFAVIVTVVGVEVAVKKGRLPKLAAKREAQKQKRLAKIEAKRQAKLGNPQQKEAAETDVEAANDSDAPTE